ncbi:hypothetical protein H0H92_008630, partial [Tricholoma furcatifolium]
MAHNSESHDNPAERSSRVTGRNRRAGVEQFDPAQGSSLQSDVEQGTNQQRSFRRPGTSTPRLQTTRAARSPDIPSLPNVEHRTHPGWTNDNVEHRSQTVNQQRHVHRLSPQIPLPPPGAYTTSRPAEIQNVDPSTHTVRHVRSHSDSSNDSQHTQLPIAPHDLEIPAYTAPRPAEFENIDPPAVVLPPSVGHTRSHSSSSSYRGGTRGRSQEASQQGNTHSSGQGPPSPPFQFRLPSATHNTSRRAEFDPPRHTAVNSARAPSTSRVHAHPTFTRDSASDPPLPSSTYHDTPFTGRVESVPEPTYVINSQHEPPVVPVWLHEDIPHPPIRQHLPMSDPIVDRTYDYAFNAEHERPGFNFLDHHDAVPTHTTFMNVGADFITQSLPVLPQETYHTVLLRLPSFYYDRVATMFKDLNVNMLELEGLALQGMVPVPLKELEEKNPACANLKVTWEDFIDSLLREWKTLNIISALLLSAILTLLQLDGAGSDPVTRNCSLIALICALLSLLFGCIYIIRFASMRKTYTALKWAQ